MRYVKLLIFMVVICLHALDGKTKNQVTMSEQKKAEDAGPIVKKPDFDTHFEIMERGRQMREERQKQEQRKKKTE
jgi:hypothetical protein